MKTKLLILIMILSLSLSAFSPAFAAETGTGGSRVIDNAGILNAEQKTYLEERITSVSDKYKFDLVILTERSIDTSYPGEYADNFFDSHGYGMGPNRDGSLFLQVTESRDYALSPSGRGLEILNNTAFNKLESDTVKFLGDRKYFEAYRAFIDNWETFLTLEAKGRNYNFFYRRNGVLLLIAWALAILTGIYIVALWKSRMNTALAQTRADAYTVPESLIYKEKKDRFLYSTVTKTKREKSSSGGGSSGRSGRGRSGKY